MRIFRTFSYRDASYRISPSEPEALFNTITGHIKKIRDELERYIKIHPGFLTSLEPVQLKDGAPEPAVIMAEAAALTGLGPMSAVAGTTAQLAAEYAREAAEKAGASEIIIENGGDIFILPLTAPAAVVAGIFSGLHSRFSSLALKILPEKGGTALCSSSGRLGHSLSLGDCDLSTVISNNAAIADSAATLGGNLVKKESDLGPAAENLAAIQGVQAVMLIKNDQLAISGRMPEIIRHTDPEGLDKITGTVLQEMADKKTWVK